jgi:hypothetical protein
MNDFLFDLGVSAILTALRSAVKNPERKAQFRRVMLKIYDQIGIVFGGDSEFMLSAIKQHKIVK